MVLLSRPPETQEWDRRAAKAEAMVLGQLVGRYRRIPGTFMGKSTEADAGVKQVVADGTSTFNYWWQAHLLDAIVDGGWRRSRGGDVAGAKRSARRGHRLLRTIWLRNGATFANHFYDDMAWLTLAVERLAALDEHLSRRLSLRSLTPVRRTLTRYLLQSRDPSGGVVWNKDRAFLNAATCGPVALHMSRIGRVQEARGIVEWMYEHLLEDRGLILDGVRRSGERVTAVYTYNQGTTLGALLSLGQPQDLERAAELVQAVSRHLSDGDAGTILKTHGSGDGGLFTGILVRYLALAARDPRLDAATRSLASQLVVDTSTALETDLNAAQSARSPHVRRELSTQIQTWMAVEATARLIARNA